MHTIDHLSTDLTGRRWQREVRKARDLANDSGWSELSEVVHRLPAAAVNVTNSDLTCVANSKQSPALIATAWNQGLCFGQ